MKITAVVVLVLFFIVLGCVLYFSISNHNRQVQHVPADGQHSGAFRLLDSDGNGV